MTGNPPPKDDSPVAPEDVTEKTTLKESDSQGNLSSVEPELESEKEKEQTPKPKREAIGRTFGLVALVTFLSKFVGLTRDIAILYIFGTSTITDAYYFAYLLTGNILVLFGGLGGPFHSAAVSIITPYRDKEETGKLISQILLTTGAFLSVIAIAVYALAPYIVSTVTPGADKEAVLTALNIMTPLIVIAGLVGAGAGISNVYKIYFWPSIAPAVASIAIIAGVFLFPDKNTGVICLATATLAGAFGQFLVQLPGIFKANPKMPGFPKIAPGLKAYLFMLGPAAIATTIGQLNIYIDAYFVSQLEHGSYTALLNANRLIQLPLGVLLTAMIVPILPRFSEQVAAKEIDELKAEFRRALRVLWFLVLPLVGLLFSMAGPVVELLFQRGNFDENSRNMVVLALSFLIPSVFFYVARDLLTRVFYAHQDSTTPFRIGLAAIGVKAVSDYLLVGPLGLGGIALSTTLTTIFNMIMLTTFCTKKIGSLHLASLVKPAMIMVIASLASSGAAYFIQVHLETLLATLLPSLGSASASIIHFISLAASITVAAAIALSLYIMMCMAARLEEPTLAYKKLEQLVKRKVAKR